MKLEFHVSLFIFHEKNICIERVCTKNRIVGRKKIPTVDFIDASGRYSQYSTSLGNYDYVYFIVHI